jgi:hypothetical protein
MQIRIPVNLRGIVYCTVLGNSGEAEWNFAREQYLSVNVASEKDRILTALTCSRDEETLKRLVKILIIFRFKLARNAVKRSLYQNLHFIKKIFGRCNHIWIRNTETRQSERYSKGWVNRNRKCPNFQFSSERVAQD